MYCTKCKKQNPVDATFCQHCGNKLEKSEKKTDTQPQQNITKKKRYGPWVFVTITFTVLLDAVKVNVSAQSTSGGILLTVFEAILGVCFIVLLILWLIDLIKRLKK